MKLSVLKGHEGYDKWEAYRRGSKIEVMVDGVAVPAALEADEEAGIVKAYVRRPEGGIEMETLADGQSYPKVVTLTGKVVIVVRPSIHEVTQ